MEGENLKRRRLTQKLMAAYFIELGERSNDLNRDLLELEKNPPAEERDELLNKLFRTAHSLKGASRAVRQPVLEQLGHYVEDLLGTVRDGSRSVTPDFFNRLFRIADALADAAVRIREGRTLEGSPVEAIVEQLVSGPPSSAGVVQSPPEPVAPSPAPAPAVAPETTAATAGALPAGEPGPPPGSFEPGWPGIPPAPPDGFARPAESTRSPAASGASPTRGEATSPAVLSEEPGATDPDATLPGVDPFELGPNVHVRLPPRAPRAPGSIRVSEDRLDLLRGHTAELSMAIGRLEMRSEELSILRQDIRRLRKEFLAHDKLAVRAAREGRPPGVPSPPDRTPSERRRPRAVGLRARMSSVLKDVDLAVSELALDRRSINGRISAVDEDIRRLRMLYFTEACEGLHRMIRDLSQSIHKEVDLIVQGDKVELDRSILEGLRDPLVHLVRNAVDHGIESPAVREAQGKPRRGRVWVTATVLGAQVAIEVGDDGRGLDLEAIRRAAAGWTLPTGDSVHEIERLIFCPGVTTAPILTEVSGRGVGLDVVRSEVESLHGTIAVAFEPGRGTRFTLTVPITLSKLRAVLVTIGNRIFAVPSASIRAVLRIQPSECQTVEGREVVLSGARPVATASLARVLGVRAADPRPIDGRVPVVIVEAGDDAAAFLVDEVLAESVIVEKGLGERLEGIRKISGAAVLPDGRVALVLNAAELVRASYSDSPASTASNAAPAGPRKRLLVVDDSVTTRVLERGILEAAGYEVTDAADGMEAWQLLEKAGADLVITDVEMPRVDGFTLTQTIRASHRFSKLPVVLLTTMSSEQDVARGIEVGANAYIIKRSFDQTHLLETLARLLGPR